MQNPTNTLIKPVKFTFGQFIMNTKLKLIMNTYFTTLN